MKQVKKIVIKDVDGDISVRTNKMYPEDFINIIAQVLAQSVKNFGAVKDKKEFKDIMGKYYDDIK